MTYWKALFTGDIFIADSEPMELSAELNSIFKAHEIISCNFEAPVIFDGEQQIEKAGPALGQNISSALAVLNAGFNLVNLANNHISDYGSNGIRNTLKAFDGITTVGAGLTFEDVYQLRVVQIDEVNVGFMAFAEWGFGCVDDYSGKTEGYAWINHPKVNGMVAEAKLRCDVLIVQVHAGVESIKLPLPEWRRRYRELIDAGATAVIGHHPHVMQGWEMYKDSPIFYSLGNFYFSSTAGSEEWNSSYCISLHFEGKTLKKFNAIPAIKIGHRVEVFHGKEDDLYNLCEMIATEQYEDQISEIVLRLWEERYRPYYDYALSSIRPGTTVATLLRRVRLWFLKKADQDKHLLLLHNLRIESHRYCVERALMKLTGIQ